MDSTRVKEYKSQVQDVFRQAKDRSGFVDWRHMGNLSNGIAAILADARQELSAPEDRWDLFEVANAIFRKWGRTQMDDDGDTAFIMNDVAETWEEVASRLVDEKEQRKAMKTFMKFCDGSVIDYMEDYAYDFLDAHFKTPELLKSKREFWEEKIKAVESLEDDDFAKDYYIPEYRDYLLQVLADEGAPIEEVEQYAARYHSFHTDDRLLGIYASRGEDDREIALLKKLIAKDSDRPLHGWGYEKYEHRLKDLYQRLGRTAEYRGILKQMFYERPGNDALYKEYRGLFSKEGWKKETEENVFPALAGTYRGMPLFAKEKRYDLLMDVAEKIGSLEFHERVLKKYYPERCLRILEKNADEEMERSTDRKGYQRVAKILKKMKSYPDGAASAEKLAEKYRQQYPRRRALLEELSKI